MTESSPQAAKPPVAQQSDALLVNRNSVDYSTTFEELTESLRFDNVQFKSSSQFADEHSGGINGCAAISMSQNNKSSEKPMITGVGKIRANTDLDSNLVASLPELPE